MTDQTTSREERLAQLRQRGRRQSPALGARIAVSGASVATMFGLVGAMGLAQRSAAAPEPAPEPTTLTAPPVIVVVRQQSTSPTTPSTQGPLTSGPIELTATPRVRVVEIGGTPAPSQVAAPTPAPAATTRASH